MSFVWIRRIRWFLYIVTLSSLSLAFFPSTPGHRRAYLVGMICLLLQGPFMFAEILRKPIESSKE